MKLPLFSRRLKKLNSAGAVSWPLIVRVISGHSMMPVVPPGTVVWGWQWFKRLRTGDIVIFKHDGKEKIKRIAEVKDDELYLLGDHLKASKDSRHFGMIPKSQVMAKVFWPHAPRERAEAEDKG